MNHRFWAATGRDHFRWRRSVQGRGRGSGPVPGPDRVLKAVCAREIVSRRLLRRRVAIRMTIVAPRSQAEIVKRMNLIQDVTEDVEDAKPHGHRSGRFARGWDRECPDKNGQRLAPCGTT